MATKAKVVKAVSPMPKLAKFLQGYSNNSTRSGYKTAIESFLRCTYAVKKDDEPDYISLFEMYLIDAKRDHDEDFRRFSKHLRATRPALSAKQTMQAVRYTLNYHGVIISKGTSQDIRRETMKGSAATVDRVLTTKLIADALQHCDIKARALFLCLASSGSRLNEMLTVNIADCDFESRPAKIVIRGENTKTKQQRYTYISDEAVAAVKEWLKVRSEYITMSNAKSKKLIERGRAKVKSDDDPRLFPFSDAAVSKWWSEALEATGQLTNDSVTGWNQLRKHGFRKFFISQMSLVISKEIPEFLAGHAGYLTGAYRRYDEETTAAEYMKAQHMVSITGVKQIKELENEFKSAMVEQSAKTERFSETAMLVVKENMQLKQQVAEMQKRMTAVETAIQKALSQKLTLAEVLNPDGN